jgi:hypothetical protein
MGCDARCIATAQQAPPNKGFVYVATGEGYVREARISAASLRTHHPSAIICLITDDAQCTAAPPFDHVIVRTDVNRNTADKLLAIEAPYDRIVFLDTDTHVCGRLDDLFDLLDRFDLAMLLENNRGWHYDLPGVPLCYPEYNSGVIAFRRTPSVHKLFADWRVNYDSMRARQGIKEDQSSLRKVLYFSDLRVAVLPSEYHFLCNVPNYIMWKAHLIHGRGDLPAIAAQVNSELGPRAYLPFVGVMRGYLGRRNWLRTLLRVTWRMCVALVRRPKDPSLLNPGRWWL